MSGPGCACRARGVGRLVIVDSEKAAGYIQDLERDKFRLEEEGENWRQDCLLARERADFLQRRLAVVEGQLDAALAGIPIKRLAPSPKRMLPSAIDAKVPKPGSERARESNRGLLVLE